MIMNKIKFTEYNTLGQPISAKLTYANGDVEVINKIITSRYYDSFNKKCYTYPKFYKINNTLYA
jgi:hypothetical protein